VCGVCVCLCVTVCAFLLCVFFGECVVCVFWCMVCV